MHNEPVRASSVVAGVLVAVSTALLMLDGGASLYASLGTAIAELAVVVGGGELGRAKAYGPDTVDEIMDAEAVVSAAERE